MTETPLWIVNLFLALYAGSAVFALWVIDTGRRALVPHLATAMVIGLLGFTAGGFVAVPTAIGGMICFTVVATLYMNVGRRWRRQIRYGGMLLGLLAGFHLVPGFDDVPLWSRWWEEGGRFLPFDLSLDKAFAGLLLALIAAQFHPQKQSWRFVWIAPLGALGLLGLVLLLGHPLEPQWPRYAVAMLFINLVVTCFAEELFFRGAMQRELMLYLAPLPAIAITSVLFGLVHIGRGWEFSLLAMLAGALYGTVYFRTGALTLAVLTHFMVNAGWILLFPSVR